MKAQVFKVLAEPVRRVLEDLGFSEPTEPQVRAIPPIMKGDNVLLVAPTGSGKTEAVLLPIFSRLVTESDKRGVSVVYITPHRALNRDLLKRLSYWASKLDLSIQVRHGDTEAKIRRKQAVHPPDMLVTTPETLQAILPGSRMRAHLSHVRCVIIDEVHELVSDKRGVQLTLGLERLGELAGADVQRVGLSATVENPYTVAKFLGGVGRPVKVVDVMLSKSFEYRVEFPTPTDDDYDLAEKLNMAPEASARIRRILDLVNEHGSTLIFVNSRTNAEMLGHKFSLLAGDVAVHHGSLSKDERRRIEDVFKANRLKAIVCTSTMELGVDIGQVDLVVQYLSPRQVGSLIQRVGRSGHRLNLVSKGIVVTGFSEDALEALAATWRARLRLLEPTAIHENALDVAAHQIAGILMDKNSASADEVYRIFRQAYPYRRVSKAKLLDVAAYLDSLRKVWFEGETLKKTGKTRGYYYGNLSMIPDERRYPIVDVLSDRRIGTLGDEFMAFRARVGLNFICKGRVWRIVQIEDDTGTVYVVPSEDKFAAIPGWDGEMLPVHFSLAREVGKFRDVIARNLQKKTVEQTVEKLATRFRGDRQALLVAVREVESYLKEKLPLPTHKHVLLEAFGKYFIVHVCFGEVVNYTLGSVFDAILSNNNLIVGWWNDGYRILIETPRKISLETMREVSKLLFNLTPKQVDGAFTEYLDAYFPFSSKMKAIAERFGVLPRGKVLSMERLSNLPSRFKNTPIYDETIREAMAEKVDLKTVKKLMRDIKKGKIVVNTILREEEPTPLAYNILKKYSEVEELMAPEHVFLSNVERMRQTTLSRKAKLLCVSCGHLNEEKRVRDLPEKPKCESCASGLLAKLMRKQNPDRIRGLLTQRKKGQTLTPEELDEVIYTRRTADLTLSHGKKAVAALQVKGVGPETAFRILGRMHPSEDEFYMDLLKAKIQYLRTKPFWKQRTSGNLVH